MPPSAAAPANSAALARALESFLADHPRAAILEDGRVLFDLRLAQYSISAERGRCLLHLWSGERNLVRTVAAVQPRRDTLRLETRRFGQTKPQLLTLIPDPDFRTPTTRDTCRRRYMRALEQALVTHFPGWVPGSFRSAMDMEHSFGPAYARGILSRGHAQGMQTAWAVLGVGPDEQPSTIEGALTLGILWLAYLREHSGGRRVFHGLRLVVPRGFAAVPAARMAHLNPAAAQWELYELDPSSAELTRVDSSSDGNLRIQMPQAFDSQAALARCSAAVDHLRSMLPPRLLEASEVRSRSAHEIGFSLHGLEYARVRYTLVPGTFTQQSQIFFGAGPGEILLDEATEDLFLDLMDRLQESRHPAAPGRDALYRLQPERWLESVLRRDLSVLGHEFAGPAGAAAEATPPPVYSQLPAFASASRTLLDLLTVTRQGRLAVIEIKADDDLHLPLQALDYWSRVRMLHRDGCFARLGYFPGIELSPDDPLLLMVAPALHMHPANETVLRHLAPEVPWQFIALDEHWRENCRIVLRKRSS